MREFKTLAVIIRTKDFFEADKLLTLYTKDKGRMSVKAKGVRKIRSKLSGNLDLLNMVELQIVVGKKIDTITGARLLKSYSNIKDNLKKVSLACYFAELLYKITPEKEEHREIYELTEDSLDILENIDNEEQQDILKSVFEYKLLSYLGHRPILNKCVVCKGKYSDKVFFDFEHGGIICDKCSKENSYVSAKITSDEIKTLNAFEKIKVKDILKVKNIKDVESIIKKFNFYIFDKVYKSESFYKNLKD